MTKYISKQLDECKNAVEIFNYLSQAKFDPTNIQHIEIVEKYTQ